MKSKTDNIGINEINGRIYDYDMVSLISIERLIKKNKVRLKVARIQKQKVGSNVNVHVGWKATISIAK